MADIIKALEVAFGEKGQGRVEMPPKPGIHPGGGDNFIHAMPAYIPALKSAGVKWVSGFPDNQERGLPYITGLLILNDAETGLPISVMDCVWITAMRTGAATAVAAKYLARPESSVVGILGCGVQGRSNVEALNVLFPLERVMAYDPDVRAARSYAEEIRSSFGLEVEVMDTPRAAVTGCDMVVTAGPILTPTGIPRPCTRRPSSAPTTSRSSTITRRPAIFKRSRQSTPAWRNWSPAKSPAARRPSSGQ